MTIRAVSAVTGAVSQRSRGPHHHCDGDHTRSCSCHCRRQNAEVSACAYSVEMNYFFTIQCLSPEFQFQLCLARPYQCSNSESVSYSKNCPIKLKKSSRKTP